MAWVSPSARAQTVVFAEDFENANTAGWVMDGPDDDATYGAWEMGDPVGTFDSGIPVQPEVGSDGGACAFTGQNTPGSVSQHDVDEGVVWLVSPEIDLGEYTSATLSYARWFYLRDLEEDDGDYFKVQARADGESPWETIEQLDNTQRENAWTTVAFDLQNHIPLTDTVQIRFGASDRRGAGTVFLPNILEAAVDVVEITASSGCSVDGDCAPEGYCGDGQQCTAYGDGDADGDGDVDLNDFAAFQCCFQDSGLASCENLNVTGGGGVDEADTVVFLNLLSGPTP